MKGNETVHLENIMALKGLFDWMMHLTKEIGKVHIFLCTSEQFFLSWISSKISANSVMVIGDLEKNEAKNFFSKFMPDCNQNDFETAFALTGSFLIY